MWNKPSSTPIAINCNTDCWGSSYPSAQSVCDLGVYLDADLLVRSADACEANDFAVNCVALRQFRQIRRSVPTSTLHSFVVALVHIRLDCGNAVLVGTRNSNISITSTAISTECGSATHLPSETDRS